MPEELKPCPNPDCQYPSPSPPSSSMDRVVCPRCEMTGPCGDTFGSEWNALPRREDAICKPSLQVLDRDRMRFEAACAALPEVMRWLVLRDDDEQRGTAWEDKYWCDGEMSRAKYAVNQACIVADALLAELERKPWANL